MFVIVLKLHSFIIVLVIRGSPY